MESILLKKSFQINNLKKIKFNSLWGHDGIFTTIRLIGKKPNFVLIDKHLKKFNKDIKYFDINFKLTKKFLMNFLQSQSSIKNYDHLLRVAITKKILSISLRKRNKPQKNFKAKIIKYQRALPNLKNLQYKKILALQNKINLKKEELIFYYKNKLLEGSTTNLIFIKKNKVIIPKNSYYKGITLAYLLNSISKRILKEDIFISNLNEFSEIILVGSGKGVISISSIKDLNWYRSSLKMYNLLDKIYSRVLLK